MLKVIPLVLLVLLLSSCSTNNVSSDNQPTLLSPWAAGMRPEKVKSFKRFAPYKYFKNGDLETYNYPFNGKKENTQFFFKNGKLNKIGIYLYEGNNVQEARKAWLKLYLLLKKKYGEVELPNTQIKSNKPVTPVLLSIAAAVYVQAGGKTQMAPAKQPKNSFRYSSFIKARINDEQFYFVILFINKPKR